MNAEEQEMLKELGKRVKTMEGILIFYFWLTVASLAFAGISYFVLLLK